MERIAIIGLGLIGGSLGLALKGAALKDVSIIGASRSRSTVQKARKLGAIDEEARDAAEAASRARMVIIGAPIMAVRGVLEEIAPVMREGTIVTDVSSTKSEVMRWAADLVPSHSAFIGSHPMAGKETQGIEAADATLFKDRTWVVVPPADAPEHAVQTVLGLAQLVGAQPMFMDADEHDSYVAAISHLPLTLASALFSLTFGSAAWPELAHLAAGGFRDTTRLASGSPEMAHDIVLTNRENVVHWIMRMQEELERFRQTIESGESNAIAELFARAQLERDNYMVNGPPQRDAGPPMPSLGLQDLLLGGKISSMMRRSEEMIRDSEKRIGDRR